MSSTSGIRPVHPRRFARRFATLGLCLLWSLVVLYPNPILLPRAIANAYDPQIDPDAVRSWANALPNDPAYIEQQVERKYVTYAVPWETYGVPWYYPTTREVVDKGVGDCQGQMLVLASILEAKGIPYRLRASFDHIWVEYPGKQETPGENAAIALMEDGRLQVPQRWNWLESYRIEKEYFWDAAPLSRKLLLFTGLAIIVLRRRIVRIVTQRQIALSQAHATFGQIAETINEWETKGRITADEARDLRSRVASSYLTDITPHLGAHMAMALLLPFPFASVGRAGWTLWMLLASLIRRIAGRIDQADWQHARRIHHPLVALLGAIPVIGSLAYLLASPAGRNHLLMRIVVDAALSRTPWHLYERTGARRLLMYGRVVQNSGL